jgi:HD-like signal output (HDOD) protein/CheY-like chemotaxis protein
MAGKRILLADADTEDLAEFRQVFGQQWEVVSVTSGTAALEEMKKQPCDVLIADLDLPGLDGAELLNQTRKQYPKTLCFILAPDADRERVMKNVMGAHQFLSKPCDKSTLKNNIERALALDVWIASNKMRELVARVRSFPTVPTLYIEVISALKSPEATTEQVGKIIAKDMAMMTKLMQVINSACFGLPRKINDPVEAVGLIGFEAVKSMVMTIKLLNQYDHIKPVYFSIDRMWRHSTDVARTAKQLTLMQTDDAAMAETAFTGGLLHDVGKVVLAANFDEQYRGAQSLARKQGLPLSEVEKEIFGASHGEIGAYLLGLWGMPLDLLEVAALHHLPSGGITQGFTPLTAVHLANALEHENNPDKDDSMIASKIDEAYLAQIGLLDRLDVWRAAVKSGNFTNPAPKARTTSVAVAKSVPAKAKAPEPVAKRPARLDPAAAVKPALTTAKAAGGVKLDAAWFSQHRRWVFTGMGLGVFALMVAWLISGPFNSLTGEKSAPKAGQAAPNAASQIAEATPAGNSDTPNSSSQTPEPAKAASNTGTLVVRARTAAADPAAAQSAVATPTNLTFADLKLQGIFYNSKNPTAIISGKSVHPNERLAGALVVEITPTGVTLDYQNQRKKLTLK